MGYIYITPTPKEVSSVLTPPTGGKRIVKIYIKDGKLVVEYDTT